MIVQCLGKGEKRYVYKEDNARRFTSKISFMPSMNSKAPSFKKFVSAICQKSPLQKKAIITFLNDRDNAYWQRAEAFSERMLKLIKMQDLTVQYVVDAYIKMCNDTLSEQIKFRKIGRYSTKNAVDAYRQIYSSEKKMMSYMYGLALSQFLWPNHYALLDFFMCESPSLGNVRTYLEVGPGHGLFLMEALKMFPRSSFLAVDISPISICLSKKAVQLFFPQAHCQFMVQDIRQLKDKNFDYVVMGEVLEHVDDPIEIMKGIRRLLNDDGRFFITTCANCPAIDHVYLYDSVEHIQDEIYQAGFKIVKELSLPVGDFAEQEWRHKRVLINYGAILSKR